MYRLTTAAQRCGAGTLRCAAYAVQTWLVGSALYLLALVLAGRRSSVSDEPALPPPTQPSATQPPPSARVVVLVPARDEEAGISAAVADLKGQDHPPHLLDVVVIADNCSDRTASQAATAGARVWERDAPNAPGKGQALAWAIDRLWRELPRTDAVVIVDADCATSPNLCSTIAAEIGRGQHAVQVPYEVANPSESPTAALRAAGFALKHVVRARGRARIGLSCNLFGTGMGFSAALLRRVPWPPSVTEDTELFVRLTRAGYRVAYADRTRVTSAMPVSAEQAAEQQLRWESGNAQLARRELPGLLWQAISTQDVQCLGAAAELALPSQTLMAAGGLVVLGAGLLTSDRRLVASSGATIAAQAAYVLGGLTAAGGVGLVLDALVHVPGFAASRLRVLARISAGREARTWVRTARGDRTADGLRPIPEPAAASTAPPGC